MDFVVVGLGAGALALLLGLTIRGAGAQRWSRRSRAEGRLDMLSHRVTAGRACRAGGLVLGLAGAVILLVTVIALLLGASDRAGAIVVMAAVSAAVLGGVAWAILYAHRYHPRPRSRTAARRSGRRVNQVDQVPPELAGTREGVGGGGAASAKDDAALGPVEHPGEDELPDAAAASTLERPLLGERPAAAARESDTQASGDPPPVAGPAQPSDIPPVEARPHLAAEPTPPDDRGSPPVQPARVVTASQHRRM